MAKLTMVFGALLVAIGLGGLYLHGAKPHPAYSGVVLIVCGLLANTENAKQRMLWMHLAVTVGLISFLIPAVRMVLAHTSSSSVALEPWAIHEQMLVAAVSLVYVVLCVRSFIAARRSRAL
jgi:hypothetical protein